MNTTASSGVAGRIEEARLQDAMRKQLLAEHGKAELEAQIVEQEDERRRQKNKIIELEARIAALKTRNKERRAADLTKRAEEKKFLAFQMDHLGGFLKKIEEQWDDRLERRLLL